MPLQKIQFKPGINREGTSLANEGGWFASDKIRFRSGFPEKIGGWTVNTYNTFLGTCRSLWNWVTLGQFNLLGMGTNVKFYIENGGTYNDITPIRQTTNNSTTFVCGYSQLGENINATTTTILLASAADFTPTGGLVYIEDEWIRYGTVVGNYLTNCVRGVEGTTAISHGLNTFVFANSVIVTDATASSVEIGDYVNFSGVTDDLNEGFTCQGAGGALLYGMEWDFIGFGKAPVTLSNGMTMRVTGGVVPTGLTLNTVYYLRDVGGDIPYGYYLFRVAATPNGAYIPVGVSPFDAFTVTFNDEFVIRAADLNQEYQVAATPSSSTYIIHARKAVPGNTSVTNGGGVVFMGSPQVSNGGTTTDSAYQINAGLNTTSVGTGWGAGPWNAGTSGDAWAHGWGTGYAGGGGITLQLRLWNQTNFGQYLLFASREGSLYVYDPTGGSGSPTPVYNRGTLVTGTQVPSQINFFTVSDATRITICFGCTDFTSPYGTGAYDPMLIRWSTQESYTYWLPSATNQAGSYRLSHGSFISTALQTRQEILVWTDSAIYSMQYIGPPYIWRINLLADNISIMSQNAAATAAGATYWMGVDKFYAYTGRVETLPCSVRQYVFNDLNRSQAAQIFCGTNEGYNEIWWFYCSITGPDGSNTINNPNTLVDRYVIFNHLDRVWYYGTLSRTAWLDSPLRSSPMATTYNNLLVYHEQGTDDGTTNPPSPIVSYVQSSLFDIEDGDRYSFVWRMVPDVTFDGSTAAAPSYATVNMSLIPKQNPGAAPDAAPDPTVTSAQSYGNKYTYAVQEFTELVYTRVRGRQLVFQISSDAIGTAWQLGVPTIDIRADGRR